MRGFFKFARHAAAVVNPVAPLLRGFAGPTQADSAKRLLYGQLAVWTGHVTGTSATVGIYATNAYGSIEVSVDGGAFVTTAVPSGASTQTLFTGLSNTAHLVCIRTTAASAGAVGVALTGNPIESSTLAAADTWFSIGDGQQGAGQVSYGGQWEAHGNAGFTPANIKALWAQAKYGSNVASMRFRADATGMYVVTQCDRIWVSKGKSGAPTAYTSSIAAGTLRTIYVPCNAGVADYMVWEDKAVSYPRGFSVGVVGTVANSAAAPSLHRFGDSITEGNATYWGAVDVFAEADRLGYTAATHGVSGAKVSDLLTRIQAMQTAGMVVPTGSAAVVLIGVNDIGSWNSTWQTNYQSVITTLLAMGYRRVLCLQQPPMASPSNSTYDPMRTLTAAAVTAVNDTRVKLIDTSAWPVSAGMHPTDTEYMAYVNQAVTAFTTALA